MKDGRRKGAVYMNYVARRIAYWLNPKLPAKAKMEDLPVRQRETSRLPIDGTWKNKGDLWVHPKFSFRFAVECKKQEGWELDGYTNLKWPVWSWWEQALDQAIQNDAADWPMLIFSRNRRPDYVILDTVAAECLGLLPKHGPLLRIERVDDDALTMVLIDDLLELNPRVMKNLGNR